MKTIRLELPRDLVIKIEKIMKAKDVSFEEACLFLLSEVVPPSADFICP